jgi:hypothetical protein
MQRVATPLRISGVITIATCLVLGIVVTPIIFFGVLVGVIDLVLATAFARGWIGGSPAGPDDASKAEEDPSYNPYARED